MSTIHQGKHDHLVGVISDTHGILPPEAVKAFEGAELIIHAGDIGKPEVLKALRAIAPVVAVRGNMDWGAWTRDLPETQLVTIGEVSLYVLHNSNKLDLEPAAAGLGAVISGHTHRPSVDDRNGVLFLNPGTAGSSGSSGSVALLRIRGSYVDTQLVELKP
jgi:putative phosphoesterase